MKTILVPVDFSKTTKNTISYAVEIAKKTNAKLVLMHAFHVPVVSTDVMVIPPITEVEKGSNLRLKKMADEIQKGAGKKLKVEFRSIYNLPVEAVEEYTKKHKVDLIIMGMQGGGILTEKIIGSSTTSVMRKVTCPVLAIDRKVKFKVPKKMVLACDFTNIPSAATLKPMKQLAGLFKASLLVLNVMNEFETVPLKGKEKINPKLKKTLVGTKHNFNFVKNNDVVKGINDFTKKQKADMIVMIPHKHSLYERLFFEYDSKRMAFHTKYPLLTLKSE